MTFSTGWPIQKPTRDAGTRSGAQEAKLAISRRMDALASVPLFACLSKRQLQALAFSEVSMSTIVAFPRRTPHVQLRNAA